MFRLQSRGLLSPILYMVGMSLDHNHASRLAVEMMSKLGYSVSYDEVYVLSSALHSVATMKTPCKVSRSFSHSGLLIKTDHNVNTLDGSGRFHSMSIVSMTMPCTRPPCGHFLEKPVPRLEHVSVLEVIKNRGIPLLNYVPSEPTGLAQLNQCNSSTVHL